MRLKCVLAGGIVRDICFFAEPCLDVYLHSLDIKCVEYKILERFDRDDGSVIIRILTKYNDSPLIQLYEENA